MRIKKIELLDGTMCYGHFFEEEDFLLLKEIFQDWMMINEKLKHLGGRNLNVPDVFSEALFCYFFNAIRTNGTAYSYDCVSLDTRRGVQVKSASIEYDCTSFGPTSTWDDLYYVDFAPNGHVDGNVFFYKIRRGDKRSNNSFCFFFCGKSLYEYIKAFRKKLFINFVRF